MQKATDKVTDTARRKVVRRRDTGPLIIVYVMLHFLFNFAPIVVPSRVQLCT